MNRESENSHEHRIGIDVGGTKIAGVFLAPDGATLARHRAPLPGRTYHDTLTGVAAIVRRLEAEAGQKADRVGMAVPGPVAPDSGLRTPVNVPWLNGPNLVADLAECCDRPIKIANDADCFAISEATDGAGADARSVAGIILGTGVGAGFVFNGLLHEGHHGLAGEWGHNPLPWPALSEATVRNCGCGRQGCIETYLSGPALERESGMPPRELAAKASSGDIRAGQILNRYADALARALASLINIIDPEVIVLGGGLSNIEILYELVPNRLKSYTLHDQLTTKLRRAAHGDDSGVRGAAWL